jgi:hypothetical protein
MDLGFDDHADAAAGDDFSRRGAHFVERLGGDFQRDGDAVSGEQLLGLIFVDVHFKI